jgi:hypothetical protein
MLTVLEAPLRPLRHHHEHVREEVHKRRLCLSGLAAMKRKQAFANKVPQGAVEADLTPT